MVIDVAQLNAAISAAASAAGRATVSPPASGRGGSAATRIEAPAHSLPPAPAPASPPAPVPDTPRSADLSEAGREAIQAAVAQIKKYLQYSPATLEFSVDEASGRVLLRIMDAETKQLIRQIPPDEVLAIARALGRFQQGLLLELTA